MRNIISSISGTYVDSVFSMNDVANSGRNASLTLKIKVKLVKINPPDGADTGVVHHGLERNLPIQRWTNSEWSNFIRSFRSKCINSWSNKLWLTPTHDRLVRTVGAARDMTVRPNIACLLDVRIVTSGSQLTCRVVRPSVDFSRSSMNRRRQLGHLDIYDVKPKPSGQIPVAHELGHYLGYDHVGGRGNGDDNYCTSATNPSVVCNPHSAGDIMGSGMRVEEWHARAWQNRVARHLGDVSHSTEDWNVPQSARDRYVASRHRRAPIVSSPATANMA